MACPFPGMDPYIERPEIWPDFHDSLIACIRANLQPQLKPKFVALTQDRLYVLDSHRPIYPDVGIIEVNPHAKTSAATAVLDVDAPAIFPMELEQIREPFIEIVEPAAGNRVVTAIEVLSPTNKLAGPGRDSYVRKRQELWDAGVNIVEVDLLRDGDPTVWLSARRAAGLKPWHYLVVVSRQKDEQQEVYAIPLRRTLPRVAIPLTSQDNDVKLDLQAVFTRCYDEGPYPALLHYQGAPPGTLAQDDIQWCGAALGRA